jgi:hypothetical protein
MNRSKLLSQAARYAPGYRGIAMPVLAAGIALGVLTSAQAQGSTANCVGNNGTDISVTGVVADKDANNMAFQFQSDSLGPYVTYNKSRTDQVSSVIQANSCDWVLAMSNSASRTVTLTFSPTNQESSSASPPFTGPQKVTAYIISKCGKNPLNNGLSYGTMSYAGQTLECGFSTAFVYNGIQYALRMNPNDYAGTNWVQATCSGAISNLCNAWTVVPIPNMVMNAVTGQSSSIGELVQITTSKGKTVETSLGLYYVAFYVTIHE